MEAKMEVTMYTDTGAPDVTVMDYNLNTIMHLHMDCFEAFQNGVEMWFTCTPLWEPEILRVTYRIDIVRDSVAAMSQHIRLPHESSVGAF